MRTDRRAEATGSHRRRGYQNLTVKGWTMDKDRTSGAASNIKGKIKEVAGKVMGNERMEAEGKAEQVGGKAQQTVGQAKDTVREAVKK